MLREQHDLSDVHRRVRHRSIQRFDDEERFVADVHGAIEVPGCEGLDRAERCGPPRLPARHHLIARRPLGHLEFRIAVAIRLLAVSRQEIREARSQVAGNVLDDNREAVRFGIDGRVQLVVADLRERFFGERFEVPVGPDDVAQIRFPKRVHG